MKNRILRSVLVSALVCLCMGAYAVPAKPGKHIVIQPDGTAITVVVHGDEWFHYTTDESGRILEEDSRGFMVVSNTATLETVAKKMTMARLRDKMAAEVHQPFLMKAPAAAAAAKVGGSPKIPVILVEFSDKAFKISNPKQAFTDLLMKKGYSANGGTGSVLDYYTDQSRGAFTPEFVVMDVVTLTGTMSTYGSTDENAAKAIYEACQKLDATVDFSQFDNDKDGKVDMILMYFAGYNEAEGGPSATIWPHQFYVPYVVTNAQSFDGVKLDRYFCTSELKGSYGTNMCGIGTTCHEFGHSIGLPDMYDTNYNEYGDGNAGATYAYDVMCSGSYNNGGCTPPWMNSEELIMLGWMDDIQDYAQPGPVTLGSISSQTPVALRTPTSDAGEYFLYECRPGTSWDAPLTPGLLVYHVDKSKNRTVTWKRSSYQNGSSTPYNLWADWESYNAINCNGSHPCFYVVPSGNITSLNYSGSNFTFPGGAKVTSYTPVDWNQEESDLALSDISFNSTSKTVSFNLISTSIPVLSGKVTDSKGNPLSGAVVTVTSESDDALKVQTDASGAYMMELDDVGTFVVKAGKSGYQTMSATVQVTKAVTQDFTLMAVGETLPNELYLYPDDAEWGAYGSTSTSSWRQMAANRYPASMMNAYAGRQIKSLSFIVGGESSTSGSVYALLDVGSTRKYFKKVTGLVVNGWNTVDLTSSKIYVEMDKDIYAGYALNSWRYNYPFYGVDASNLEDKGYMSGYSSTTSSWQSSSILFIVKIELMPGDSGTPSLGRCYIEDPSEGIYFVGESFDLKLVRSDSDKDPDTAGVKWFLDDAPVSGESVDLLSSGLHTISVRFTSREGKQVVIEKEVSVK